MIVPPLSIVDVTNPNLARVPIQQTHHYRFTGPARARDFSCAVGLVHESGEAAYKRFVSLKVTGHLLKRAALHRKPDAMVHEPRGFLSYANRTVNLV